MIRVMMGSSRFRGILIGATTATATAASVLVWQQNKDTLLHRTQAEASLSNANKARYLLETDLMDKIAAKSYLQERHRHAAQKNSNKRRPKGVPRTMRILVIDLPELRYAFDGSCQVNHHKVFPDGVAPPKVLNSGNLNDESNGKQGKTTRAETEVMQKSLAQALIRCRNDKSKRVGVDVMEVSIAELNPSNLRRTHAWGSYWYDPGKFARKETRRIDVNDDDYDEPTMTDYELDEGSANDTKDSKERKLKNDSKIDRTVPQTGMNQTVVVATEDGSEQTVVLASEHDELDAPWNQYAWIEEINKRVAGSVRFGAPMERSSRLSRLLSGSVYKQTIPSARPYYEWFLPPFLQRDPSGVDGENRGENWQSQKPHAIIAHGAAMQRVPGSMKFLSDCCKENNVPLYIVNDPRGWGGNTHKDLPEALKDMRREIKRRIVAQVLNQQGSAFSTGRLVGQLETEAKWQAKDAKHSTQKAIRKANKTYIKSKRHDWSKMNPETLREKLIEHQVITMYDHYNRHGEIDGDEELEEIIGSDELAPADEKKKKWWTKLNRRKKTKRSIRKDGTEASFYSTGAMLEICRQCLENATIEESKTQGLNEKIENSEAMPQPTRNETSETSW